MASTNSKQITGSLSSPFKRLRMSTDSVARQEEAYVPYVKGESRASTSYVCEKYKYQGSDLIKHENLQEAASVKQRIEVESQSYNPNIQPIIYQVFVLPLQGKEVDQAIIHTHVEELSKVLDIYETRLSTTRAPPGTKYLAGDIYSLDDVLNCF